MPTMWVRLHAMIGMWAVSLALFGCVSLSREEQPVHTFILSLGSSSGGAAIPEGKPGAGILVVNVPVAQPGFDTPRMAYTQRPYEVSYYATHQWADPPARMLIGLPSAACRLSGSRPAFSMLPRR